MKNTLTFSEDGKFSLTTDKGAISADNEHQVPIEGDFIIDGDSVSRLMVAQSGGAFKLSKLICIRKRDPRSLFSEETFVRNNTLIVGDEKLAKLCGEITLAEIERAKKQAELCKELTLDREALKAKESELERGIKGNLNVRRGLCWALAGCVGVTLINLISVMAG